MSTFRAMGLRGNWLNGWLAAIGVTVLLPGTRLSWSSDVIPTAIFEHEGDLADDLAGAFPSEENLNNLTIARHHKASVVELQRNVTPTAFADRSRLARASHDGALEASLTDLILTKNGPNKGTCVNAPFNPPFPNGRTLHDQLMKVRSDIDGDLSKMTDESLRGRPTRLKGSGLGFDVLRFPSGVSLTDDKLIDPVVELLCFYGVLLLPMRGRGERAAQRGWTSSASRRHAFTWPVWRPSIDRWSIDGILGVVWGDEPSPSLPSWGVTGMFGSVAYQKRNDSDPTRAYASERLW